MKLKTISVTPRDPTIASDFAFSSILKRDRFASIKVG